ncbi:MAG: hypothetical protein HYT79_12130 [Elusimicrobia bacterium]|nr:hypothetical protein [Elusimicrobiota bacterium]
MPTMAVAAANLYTGGHGYRSARETGAALGFNQTDNLIKGGAATLLVGAPGTPEPGIDDKIQRHAPAVSLGASPL